MKRHLILVGALLAILLATTTEAAKVGQRGEFYDEFEEEAQRLAAGLGHPEQAQAQAQAQTPSFENYNFNHKNLNYGDTSLLEENGNAADDQAAKYRRGMPQLTPRFRQLIRSGYRPTRREVETGHAVQDDAMEQYQRMLVAQKNPLPEVDPFEGIRGGPISSPVMPTHTVTRRSRFSAPSFAEVFDQIQGLVGDPHGEQFQPSDRRIVHNRVAPPEEAPPTDPLPPPRSGPPTPLPPPILTPITSKPSFAETSATMTVSHTQAATTNQQQSQAVAMHVTREALLEEMAGGHLHETNQDRVVVVPVPTPPSDRTAAYHELRRID